MKVTVLYKPNQDYTRTVDDFLRDFTRRTGTDLETLDPDTREGDSICRTYDIVQYPTIIAVSDDGLLQNSWSGLPLPTISEVSYYKQ